MTFRLRVVEELMKPRWEFDLSEQDLARLHELASGKCRLAADRARVILWVADGVSNAEIASQLGYTIGTVRVYHTKFRQGGMAFIEPKARCAPPAPKADAIRLAAQRLWNGRGANLKPINLRDICADALTSDGVEVSEKWASVVMRSKKTQPGSRSVARATR
jgi:transposase